MNDLRIGLGTDIHRLEAGRRLIIGGIEIASDLGAVGHSDADVLLHSITDAILGALALGDIGTHFPSTDDQWQDSDSGVFLKFAIEKARSEGYEVVNLDAVVNLESPMLGPHIASIRENISNILDTPIGAISVKAKSREKVDAVGERRAISTQVVVLMGRKN